MAESSDQEILGGDDFARLLAATGFSWNRLTRVKAAQEAWRAALLDRGRLNNLLYYAEDGAGTFELTTAPAALLESLLAGEPVTIGKLTTAVDDQEQLLRRARAIYKKSRENLEERGIETLSLGCGLATWADARATKKRPPSAPVLLRRAKLSRKGQEDFELKLEEEMEVNPTLLRFLQDDFGCSFPQERLLERLDGMIDEPWELHAAYDWLAEHASGVPGFSVDLRIVLTNFAYAKLPLERDIEDSFEQLVASDLVAAIAGDEEARELVRTQGLPPDGVPEPDSIPLADEFLILDADSSQSYAINAVLGGASLIVRGPPGTGKSQTISNLIASLVAREKKVLFVAEKRAAIDAVLKRLAETGLDDFVLDLHGGAVSRRAFAERIGNGLTATRSSGDGEGSRDRSGVEATRAQLNAYVAALHTVREPWGLSVFEMRSELIGLGPPASDLRFSTSELATLDGSAYAQAASRLGEFAALGGLTLPSSGSPWRDAVISSGDEAQQAGETVSVARRDLKVAVDALAAAANETGVAQPSTFADWGSRLSLWQDVAETLVVFEQSVFDLDLAGLCASLASAEQGGFALAASLTSGPYKGARRELRQHLRAGTELDDATLLARAKAAADEKTRWNDLGEGGTPQAPSDSNLGFLHAQLSERLTHIESVTRISDLAQLPVSDLERLLADLASDRDWLPKLPRLYELETELRASPLGALLHDLQARAVERDRAVPEFRGVWLRSILDAIAFVDLTLGAFDAEQHEAVVHEYQAGDVGHIEATPARIRHAVAQRLRAVRESFPEQVQFLLGHAKKKSGHKFISDVVRQGEDVLLALKPCWAMSPLLVSQLLPAKTMFDVVIFDEASQIAPADAIPSIFRGTQVVVAGDDRQLPPTPFFVAESPEEPDELPELPDITEVAQSGKGPGITGTKGFESILDAMHVILPVRTLEWHYRSRDERLIAFSNVHLYDQRLVTFPGVGGRAVLRSEVVAWQEGAGTNSPTPEVDRVVELIVSHAKEHPAESLGVIAMGSRHADRIDEALRRRLRSDSELELELRDFFSDSRPERFFVKSLENVQGDERDAIILTIGYGKNDKGVLSHNFGPLNKDGGERRLNVAVTRAKSRITVVSSFAAEDIDLGKTQAAGVSLLKQYLQYVASNATDLGDVHLEKPLLNAFESDVLSTMAERGVVLTPQYGVSGYLIDFVAPHPTQPGRWVLAIECDGVGYSGSRSARDRDRLRQQQLENLGWAFHRIWSSEWFHHKERCAARLKGAYEEAVRQADQQPTAGALI